MSNDHDITTRKPSAESDFWAQAGRAAFMERFELLEKAVAAIAEQFIRNETAAVAFFQEQAQRLKRVEKLVTMLAEKGGATAEELAALSVAVTDLGTSREGLQDAINRSSPK
jgi:hypothetical protein